MSHRGLISNYIMTHFKWIAAEISKYDEYKNNSEISANKFRVINSFAMLKDINHLLNGELHLHELLRIFKILISCYF